ncbi:MAG: alpha/beta fold hydrolase, partial [Candidatus Binatia bacterium]
VTPDKLTTLKTRTLLVTGDADMFTPPSIMRMIAHQVRNNELVIIPECGHSPYWEQPELFNRTVLEFIRRSSK